ncbi:SubName: Full=Uncharacterized protein {ECO:0000313/EMBL:CCA74158.1} [Serendipita indica DSM 11827]|uniref:F-box domain-containing protein n=1 Tax=Serendipita indica (strain DSM 11827) TaxID=1109443 RepID=G4TS65_SERID|nr:SubName: Full=Uncharacterized protein {ECO:0000313/EMBL:CCA74158.1} [Serendipita indica DSM 11827]CCA74158.1 hypothetical protein PIIN_08111 [Serendipita indica DSM 11827]
MSAYAETADDYHVDPVLLSHVCRTWREIVLGAPTLWQVFQIYLNQKPSVIKSFWFAMSDRVKQLPVRLELIDRPNIFHHELVISIIRNMLAITDVNIDQVYLSVIRQPYALPVASYLKLFTRSLQLVHVVASQEPRLSVEGHITIPEETWFDGICIYVDIRRILEILPPTNSLILEDIAFEPKSQGSYSSGLAKLKALTLTTSRYSSIELWHLLRECGRLEYLRLDGDIEIMDAPLPDDTALETITTLEVESLGYFCEDLTPPVFPNLRELVTNLGEPLYMQQFLSVNSTPKRLCVFQSISLSLDFLSRSLPHLREALLCDIDLSTFYTASSDTEWNLEQLQELTVDFFDKSLDPGEVERVIQHRMLRMQLPSSVVTLEKFSIVLPLPMADVEATPKWQNSQLLRCAEVETGKEAVQYTWSVDW